MIEIQYIPMRTPDDKLIGHARVQGGFVEALLRGGARGQALILTDSGYAMGKPAERIRAGGRVSAVAVHAESKLVCVGFAHGSPLTMQDVRRHIATLTAAPAIAPTMHDPAFEAEKRLAADPLPPDDAIPTARPTGESAAAPRRSARHAPASTDVLETLERLSQTEEAAFLAPEPPPDDPAPRVVASADDDETRAAAFAALLSRADAVFRRINTPFAEEAPPSPFAAPRETPPPATEPVMENPFPHIFPGARFAHRGNLYGSETLMGEWERNGERFHVTAVLGSYSPQPPDALPGFTRYIRTLRGGYWVRVEDLFT